MSVNLFYPTLGDDAIVLFLQFIFHGNDFSPEIVKLFPGLFLGPHILAGSRVQMSLVGVFELLRVIGLLFLVGFSVYLFFVWPGSSWRPDSEWSRSG